MIRRVYETSKTDSRKRDFVYLVGEDIFDLEIDLSEDEIQRMSKYEWKEYVHEKVELKALESLTAEIILKTKQSILFLNL